MQKLSASRAAEKISMLHRCVRSFTSILSRLPKSIIVTLVFPRTISTMRFPPCMSLWKIPDLKNASFIHFPEACFISFDERNRISTSCVLCFRAQRMSDSLASVLRTYLPFSSVFHLPVSGSVWNTRANCSRCARLRLTRCAF